MGQSTATSIHGGIEDLWEEFITCKENKKEKKEEETQKEAIAKEGAEKICQFAMGRLRKRDAKAAPKDKEARVHKDKEIEGDSQLPTPKTPGNRSTSPIPSNASMNGLDFVSQHVAISEECQKRVWN